MLMMSIRNSHFSPPYSFVAFVARVLHHIRTRYLMNSLSDGANAPWASLEAAIDDPVVACVDPLSSWANRWNLTKNIRVASSSFLWDYQAPGPLVSRQADSAIRNRRTERGS
jgi:hypothetical protein